MANAHSTFLLRMAIGLLPVFAFLLALVFLDSYKLVRFRHLLGVILLGCAIAFVSLNLNSLAFSAWPSHSGQYARFGAPLLEEALKAACVLWLITTTRAGFMVDAAIFGFAVGSGFAAVENLFYLQALGSAHPTVWLLRGLGTAVMHGGATAIVGIAASTIAARPWRGFWRVLLLGMAPAYAIHALHNHAPFGPILSAVVLIAGLPVLMVLIFVRSEQSLEKWLSEGFDADIEMLGAMIDGEFGETRAGAYLRTLKKRFPPEAVADMFCLLQLSLELSVRAKADLLQREAGFKTEPDPEVLRKFAEMEYLHRSIGPTGKLALSPLLPSGVRDVWQLRLLR